jgi:hypothetical protein
MVTAFPAPAKARGTSGPHPSSHGMNFPGPINTEELQRKLADLRAEHRDLDDAIAALAEQPHLNLIQIQRMKKRKLALKDQITKIENLLIPDIIA